MVKTWVALSILLLCSYRAGSRPTRPLPAQKFCDLDSAGGERRDTASELSWRWLWRFQLAQSPPLEGSGPLTPASQLRR